MLQNNLNTSLIYLHFYIFIHLVHFIFIVVLTFRRGLLLIIFADTIGNAVLQLCVSSSVCCYFSYINKRNLLRFPQHTLQSKYSSKSEYTHRKDDCNAAKTLEKWQISLFFFVKA